MSMVNSQGASGKSYTVRPAPSMACSSPTRMPWARSQIEAGVSSPGKGESPCSMLSSPTSRGRIRTKRSSRASLSYGIGCPTVRSVYRTVAGAEGERTSVRRARSVRLPSSIAREQRGGDDGVVAVAVADGVHGAGQSLASEGDGIEQLKLSTACPYERRRRHPDQAHRLGQRLAREETLGPPVDLQPVLSWFAGVAAGKGAKVREPELEGDTGCRQVVVTKRTGHPLGLRPQGSADAAAIGGIDPEGRFRPHRFRRRPGLHRTLVATEGEVMKRLTMDAETSGENGQRYRLQVGH